MTRGKTESPQTMPTSVIPYKMLPRRSSFSPSASAHSSRILVRDRIKASRPIGPFTRKMLRHPRKPVSSPPAKGPTESPMQTAATVIPMALPRSFRGNAAAMIRETRGRRHRCPKALENATGNDPGNGWAKRSCYSKTSEDEYSRGKYLLSTMDIGDFSDWNEGYTGCKEISIGDPAQQNCVQGKLTLNCRQSNVDR